MTQKHVHKLKRHRYSTGNTVYFCTLPDCHFKIDTALALGKKCRCNLCDKEFIMNEYTIKLAKPHCEDCGKKKIRGADGKKHYIRKRLTHQGEVITAIAAENNEDLRARLNNLISPSPDEDI